MNGLQDMILIGEIVLQSRIAQRAAERLEATKDSFDHIEVWCSIQSILVSAGNVSKILWPSNKKYKAAGERLRNILRVDKDSILSNRKFRNHFEHYDERVHEWFSKNKEGVYIDLAMNPNFPGRTLNTHRGYNSFDNTLVFRGEPLDLNVILKALEKVRENCRPYCLS